MGARGQRLSRNGNAVTSEGEEGAEGQGVLAPFPGPGRILSCTSFPGVGRGGCECEQPARSGLPGERRSYNRKEPAGLA